MKEIVSYTFDTYDFTIHLTQILPFESAGCPNLVPELMKC